MRAARARWPAVGFDLAQVNVSRLLAPLDSPPPAEFITALDELLGQAPR